MLTVIDLWLPIVISTGMMFIASSVIHMAVQWHNRDYRGLPDEPGTADVLRKQGLSPGTYMLPYCVDMKEMGSDETRKRFERGPVALMTVMPNGMPNMGRLLGLWAGYLLLLSIIVGYIAATALAPGSDYATVFRISGTAAFLPLVIANLPASIWYGQPWPTTLRFMFDGIIYSLLCGGAFAGFWPGG